MIEPVLVAVAWPYANAEIHVGNITGAYLPADIFARYQRLKGRQVLMVSGSDSHGTPITVRADAEEISPIEVYQRFHASFLELFQQMGITYDLFTSTHTSNHFKVAQAIFCALLDNGYLYKASELQWYAPSQKRFLPDRYVEGTCYLCGYENARSDQCDKCGSLLDAEKLLNPHTRVDGSVPELRQTEHYYLDLGKLQNEVTDFLEERKDYWRPNVVRQSLGQIQADKLRGRPITRDLDWGIPVPLEDMKGKCLYVWFEAVIGYLSATLEWGQLNGDPEAWRLWWHNPQSRTYYFIGKDNIPFHAIIWPAELIGVGTRFDEIMESKPAENLVLPYDVPANEFMNLESQKISGSRNWAVWGRDFLTRYDPDPLRYYLTVNMPESKDTDWDWEDFYKRNNDELVATWGNLANRVLTIAYKNWDGKVPEPGKLTEIDQQLLQRIESGFETVSASFEKVQLRAALGEAMALASEVNKYLDTTAPWMTVKTDKAAAGRAIYTAINAINMLKVMLAPFLPFTCQKLHEILGFEGQLFGTQYVEQVKDEMGEHSVLRYAASETIGKWERTEVPAAHRLNQPQPLFRKLEAKIIEDERSRLGTNE